MMAYGASSVAQYEICERKNIEMTSNDSFVYRIDAPSWRKLAASINAERVSNHRKRKRCSSMTIALWRIVNSGINVA